MTPRSPSRSLAPPLARPATHDGQSGAPAPPVTGEQAARRSQRVALFVRERLPVWLRVRCALHWRALVALTVVLLLAVGLAVHHYRTGRPEPVRIPRAVGPAPPERDASAPGATAGTAAGAGAGTGTGTGTGAGAGEAGRVGGGGRQVVVDVGGKVRRPGLLRLPVGARVADALRAAGGVRPGTDTTGLNQARLLVDGEQVVVGARPSAQGAEAPGAPAGAPLGAGAAGSAGSTGPAGPGGPSAGPVSLSSATAAQLDALPGVGPVLAQRIIDHRAAHGGFRNVEQLREVTGIGDRRFANLKDLVQP
ncbi:helix-hairpin-helix domain-containing protein [Streptomyces sp. NPDC059816]|uniref:helix-hairpin-helix domain-containing protein n=1 Tax=Streptomyces sp. NPDC059816 TaxID=3346960 RepID=UPI00365E70ED